jgi:hypothetical protein
MAQTIQKRGGALGRGSARGVPAQGQEGSQGGSGAPQWPPICAAKHAPAASLPASDPVAGGAAVGRVGAPRPGRG